MREPSPSKASKVLGDDGSPGAGRRPFQGLRARANTSKWIVLAFLLLHLATALVAANPRLYSAGSGDVATYSRWADALVDKGQSPYGELEIEYPPGILPLLVAPKVALPQLSFRSKFVALMFLLDATALFLLLRLAKKFGSNRGAWMWVVGPQLLGPITVLRLDLAPAGAVLWALERGVRKRWGQSGAALTAGILLKVYPIFLFLPFMWAATRKHLFAFGAASVVLLAGVWVHDSNVVPSVLAYHADRGIHVESSWGSALLIKELIDADNDISVVVLDYGAFHLAGSADHPLKRVSALLSLAVVVVSLVLAHRQRLRNVRGLALLSYCLVTTLLVTGSVLSPQFLLWTLALGAAALTLHPLRLRSSALLLLAAAAFSQYVYPLLYAYIVIPRARGVAVLVGRNGLLIASAIMSWLAYMQYAKEARDALEEDRIAGVTAGTPRQDDPTDR